MDSDAPLPEPPPEAELIKTAREGGGMTAAEAARRAGRAVSAGYWRDVERGWGYRRGERAAAKASARVLAAMARVTGVTPGQLDGVKREDAARVLREVLRREGEVRGETARAPVTAVPGTVSVLDLGGDEEEIARGIMDTVVPGGGGRLLPWATRRGMLKSLLDLNDRRRRDEAGLFRGKPKEPLRPCHKPVTRGLQGKPHVNLRSRR